MTDSTSVAVDFAKLKQLREKTGVSFSVCKRALMGTNNDLKKAEEKLQEYGIKKAAEKSERSANQGAIFSYIHHNRQVASLIELACETDFVATNVDFKTLGNEIAMQVASVYAKTVEEILEQPYIRDPGKKISDLIKDAVLKFGENIKINRFARWQFGV